MAIDAPRPHTLVLEMMRTENAGDPYAFRFAEQSYVVRHEDGSTESAVFPWGPEVLDDLDVVQRQRSDPVARQRLGSRLHAFLSSAAWQAHEARIAEAVRGGRPVHITVRSSAAEMYALPWELVPLRSTGQHLGELPGCLIRYEWQPTETAPPDPDPPPEGGRILFAWSASGGAVPAAQHLNALRRACLEGHYPFDEVRDVVPAASLLRLREALAAPGPPVAVLHLLCHGGAVPSDTAAYGLILDPSAPGEAPDVIDASALRQALAPFTRSLRLVVLCACHGGNPGAPGNHLGSLAQALHRIGIPAVVAASGTSRARPARGSTSSPRSAWISSGVAARSRSTRPACGSTGWPTTRPSGCSFPRWSPRRSRR
ncbi:uncharacterized protein SOCE26_042120 [Sorangium cellulosum]|uniref:CHAT domain-containing protein n=1 Tax=Sorangium cellulosum TaxID=56 RepID=A0A2L0ETZ3_SORCE|nr:CHAT domain-containing protein [Sorangium cellulosum]AUX42778.1 uncharacterized protein SOCE26_042120 [Sorangium cellulosum]